jgi:tRNA threonylcarbamoyladenosine biosynthesis protein TsaE
MIKKKMLISNLVELKDFCKKLPLNKDSVVLLSGELGAGKTSLVASCLEELLGKPGPFTSPTFNIIHSYSNKEEKFYHLDLYRLKTPQELIEIGFPDLLQEEAIIFIEWPELARDFLSAIKQERIIKLELSILEGEKRIIKRVL